MSILQGEAGRQEEHCRRDPAAFSLCLKSTSPSSENQSIQVLNTNQKSHRSVSKWTCAYTGRYSISPQLMLIRIYDWGHRVVPRCSTSQVFVSAEAVSERKLFSSDHWSKMHYADNARQWAGVSMKACNCCWPWRIVGKVFKQFSDNPVLNWINSVNQREPPWRL